MAGESMRDIKRRITSVKNTQQITKAMEMVSAAKLRRSQNQVTASRPFADKLREVLTRLVGSVRGKAGAEAALAHPLLVAREARRVLYVAVAADRGLAGGYNANLVRRLGQILDAESREADVFVIGRKAGDYVRKRGLQPVKEYVQIGDEIDF